MEGLCAIVNSFILMPTQFIVAESVRSSTGPGG